MLSEHTPQPTCNIDSSWVVDVSHAQTLRFPVFLDTRRSEGEGDGWTIIITQDICVKNLVLEYVAFQGHNEEVI